MRANARRALLTLAIATLVAAPARAIGQVGARPARESPVQGPGMSQPASIGDFIAPDGSVDMAAIRASGYEGAIALGGAEGRVDANRGVRFPASPALPTPTDQKWAPLSGGLQGTDGAVRALAVHNGMLIVGGCFVH